MHRNSLNIRMDNILFIDVINELHIVDDRSRHSFRQGENAMKIIVVGASGTLGQAPLGLEAFSDSNGSQNASECILRFRVTNGCPGHFPHARVSAGAISRIGAI